ncbi:MAG: ribosome biogenesis GTPase Der [Bacteroidales bacterium]|jgi:GTP-binding protein|nr:ribosome biogenesis GTPase Der [Bacteroidales bacterium]MCI1733824.1 ribosome biogenesis GTPase Der [Bacteroidales bacterium]
MGIVAIVGRPNVGKSTLFNRMVGERRAIVDKEAGVTRDRHYGKCEWCGKTFSVIDTGGYTSNSDDVFEKEIRKQVLAAIDEADVILFMCDVDTGITDYDEEIADILRRCKKPVILAVNKVDTGDKMYGSYEFNRFGLGEPYSIAAADGGGTGDLMDKICEVLPKPKEEDAELEKLPKITIVGRPNVGKSSMTNALLGTDRNIVTPVAGTTRDSISTRYNKFGYDFMIVDTAGLRKKNKVTEDLEFYSVMRAVRSIENSDICILMIDAQEGIQAQDMNIFYLIQKNGKGCVFVVNKWDTVEKDSQTMKDFKESILEKIAPFNDVPIIFTSVINKQRIFDVLKEAMEVYQNYSRKIPTAKLNEALLPEIESHQPPMYKGKDIKIKFVTQLPTKTPSFAFFCNLPQYIKDPYKRFLENKLRSHFKFTGCPVNIFLRQK